MYDNAYSNIESNIIRNMNMFKVDEATEIMVAHAVMSEYAVEQLMDFYEDGTHRKIHQNLWDAGMDEATTMRKRQNSGGFRPQTTKSTMKISKDVENILNDWRMERLTDKSISPFELLARILENSPNSRMANIFKNEGVNAAGLRYIETHKQTPPPSITGIKKYFDHKLLLNMNKQASNDEFEPFIGREDEIEKMVRVLARQRKPNVALVGEAGVGKTALVEGLAKRIEDGDVPEVLQNTQIVSLDVGQLTAGTKYRGEFEKRVKDMVAKLEEEDNLILFIDEYHTVVGAGSASGSLDLSNMLKPLLARGKIKMIAGTTPKEYKKTIRKDAALKRRTQEIRVDELKEADTVMVCRKSVDEMLSKKHGVDYTDDAIKTAVRMAKRYMPEGRWPDTPLDVLDDAGAKMRVKYDDANERKKHKVDVANVMEIIAENTGIETARLDKGDGEQLKNLSDFIKGKVFGQDKPVDAVSKAFKRANAGVGRQNGPMGVYVFGGPTGVGKTELAKALAEATGMHFARFDMSEYMEQHSVARLKGAPPGYVGHGEGGQLTEEIRQYPFSVVLLDEIEKAHPEVMKLFLPTFDDARMTDGEGNTVDFKNTVFILTTNLKDASVNTNSIGFGADAAKDGDDNEYTSAIKKEFPPELYNRLDGVFSFDHLDKDVARMILDKLIKERTDTLFADRAIELEISEEARAYVADQGYSEELGGRPMNRAIDEYIATDELVDAILFTDLKDGGTVKIDLVDGELKHSFNAHAKGKPKVKVQQDPAAPSQGGNTPKANP